MLLKCLLSALLSPVLWLTKTLLAYFVLVLLLTIAYRAYKINWSRKNKRPTSAKDTVLVTGATSGIGLALSKHLYELGFSVIAAYYNSDEPGYEELKSLAAKGGAPKILFVELDVQREESIASAFEQCSELLESNQLNLYALVNNAGLGSLQPFAWLQRRTIKRLVDTNLLGSMLMVRQFLPLLIRSRGRVVNVASGLAMCPGPAYAVYGSTKSALVYFTRCLNMELAARYKVKAISVLPNNFIKNTNICAQNAKANEQSWTEMSDQERQLYQTEFDEHCAKTKSLEAAARHHSQLAASSAAAAASKTKPNDGAGGGGQLAQPICAALKAIKEAFRGENAALTLEQSGILDGFEDALRLEDPPEHIFAGDNAYSLLLGSVFLSMPASCIGLAGPLVAAGLYK